MQCRNALLFTAVLCAAVLVAGQSSARDLTLSHQYPETDARHRAAKVLAAELRKRVPDLAVRIHANASLVRDPPSQYEAMQQGKIDMAIYPDGLCLGEIP